MQVQVIEKPINFQNAAGETLQGFLHLPARVGKVPGVIVCHGYNQNKSFRFLVYLSRALAAEGIACLRFDLSGCGESDGLLENTSISKQLGELETAYNLLTKHPQIDRNKIVLIGHSLGALIALLLHIKLKSANPLVFLVPALNQKELILTWYSEEQIATCLKQGYIDTIKGRVGAGYIKEATSEDWLAKASLVKGATLIVQGDKDYDVPSKYAEEVFNKLPEPKKFEKVKDTDYKFRNLKHQKILAGAVLSWLRKYL